MYAEKKGGKKPARVNRVLNRHHPKLSAFCEAWSLFLFRLLLPSKGLT